MKGRLSKWICISALLLAAVGVFTLWKRVDTRVKRLLLPVNPLLVGYADLPEKTLGVRLEPFELTGWDGARVQACIVRQAEDKSELTPRQLTLLDRLSGSELRELRDDDFALVCVDWDHGIRSALPLAEQLAAAGIPCVLWEPRGSGSARPWCTHGLQESRDVPLLIRALEERTGRKNLLIAGVGRGFGANLMLQAAAAEPKLRAVVSINPTASLNKILKRARVGAPMRELIGWRMNQLTGLEPFDIAAVKSAAAIAREVPVLLIHLPEEGCAQDDAVAIYTQLQSDAKRFLTLRTAEDEPEATTRTIVYAPEGGTREVLHRVEVDLTAPDAEEVPVEMLRWLDAQVNLLREQPTPASAPIPTDR